jgi:hypothetical protein
LNVGVVVREKIVFEDNLKFSPWEEEEEEEEEMEGVTCGCNHTNMYQKRL